MKKSSDVPPSGDVNFLKILEKWECQTCGHSLIDRVDHCGEDSSHLLRKTQKNAEELLRALYKIPADKSTIDGLVACAVIPDPKKQGALKGSEPRVTKHVRIDAEAMRRIDAERHRRKLSLGDYLSEHGLSLPKV